MPPFPSSPSPRSSSAPCSAAPWRRRRSSPGPASGASPCSRSTTGTIRSCSARSSSPPSCSSSSTLPWTFSMASSIPAPAPADLAAAIVEAMPRPHGRRAPWLIRMGVAFVLLLAVGAVVAPWVLPLDPERQSLRTRLKPPTLEGADGRVHLLGTDHLGRDVFTRVIYGSRVSLVIGLAAVLVGGLIGSSLGLLAGYRGGRRGGVIMTVADGQLALPVLLAPLRILAVAGPTLPPPSP